MPASDERMQQMVVEVEAAKVALFDTATQMGVVYGPDVEESVKRMIEPVNQILSSLLNLVLFANGQLENWTVAPEDN